MSIATTAAFAVFALWRCQRMRNYKVIGFDDTMILSKIEKEKKKNDSRNGV